MPFCPECGKSIGSSQKFCRNCGAPLIEESPAAAAPPAPPPSAGLSCRSCGSQLAPDEKFCGSCGAPAQAAAVPAAPAPAVVPPRPAAPFPVNPPTPAPAPVQAVAPAATGQPAGLVCRSCGTPMTPDMKFCGSCGALAQAAFVPLVPPAYITPPPAAAAPATGTLVCRACGNQIKPGDKFCSRCFVKVPNSSAAVPAAYQAPPPAYPPPPYSPQPQNPAHPTPPPVAASAPSGTLVCPSCGNPIKPGDKFCSKCLVKVPDSLAAAPAAYQAPQPAYQPPPPQYGAPAPAPAAAVPAAPPVYIPPPPPAASPGGYVCASCGSPVSGSEKVCGICGAIVVAARTPAAPPAPAAPTAPAEKVCGHCGGAISSTTKFCGNCGAAVTPSPKGGGDSSFRPAPPVAAGGEEVIGVIANARKAKLFGASYDTWNIVVTSRRMIMVQMTAAMLTAAVAEAQAQAKAEGKGFSGITNDQLSAQFRYAVRYETMNPDMALAETRGNTAVENARITAITMKLRDTISGNTEYPEFKMVIDSSDGKFEYMMAEDDRYINLLKLVHGDKVRMPSGYSKVGGARI